MEQMTRTKLIERVRPRFTTISGEGRAELRKQLIDAFYSDQRLGGLGSSERYVNSESGQRDIENHLEHRLTEFREMLIPWLDYRCPLDGRRILEIGYGTGSSTVALIEQGAYVTGIDLEERAPAVAGLRCRLHGLGERADFRIGNAVELEQSWSDGLSMVIFFAALEHMTIDERLRSLSAAWKMLPRGGHLVVVESPNRLWYYDQHTSLDNFFHWLPDELAICWARFSQRADFRDAFAPGPPMEGDASLRLARWGRGLSFHEFSLAIGDVAQLEVEGMFEVQRSVDEEYGRWWSSSIEGAYHRLLAQVAPKIPAAFRDPWLTLRIQKG